MKAARWKKHADKKNSSLKEHGIYELIPISLVPSSQKIISTRWVNIIKVDGTFKSRLVVQGWSQVPGIDPRGTFSPVCRFPMIRMVLAIAAELGYKIFMMNVQTAFPNADVEEDVFVKIPPGYERSNKAGVPLVMKLKKNLYGLHQSPNNWFGTIDQCLGDIGFRPLQPDPCMYIYEDEVGFVVLTLYVDGFLLLGANKLLLNKLKKKLMDRLRMMGMGDVSRVLGMNDALRDLTKGTITNKQRDNTEDMIERFGLKGYNPAYTPGGEPDLPLNQSEEKCWTRRTRSVITPSRVLSCTLGRFPATTSSMPLTSGRG